jgi:type III secretory pathway component EscV
MQNLIFGIIIGFQFFGMLLLAAALFHLYQKFKLADALLDKHGERIGTIEITANLDHKNLEAETIARRDADATLEKRVQKLESIEVPEHLNLTQELIIQAEVEKRLEEKLKIVDSNYLEDMRENELAAHNRQFHP